ncbi:MAG: type II/IV secretion system protein [Methylococcales bacterium]|nr:type II/IV secretion system protein [Methylococcales bacterium]
MNHSLRESKLTVIHLLHWLKEDQIISEKDYKNCKNYGKNITSKHPLNLIADCEIHNQTQANQLMTLELLSQWLAKKVKLPYFHIDPLKIDVTSITKLCSLSYAQNHNILPIKVSDREVIIATAEPYIRNWEADFREIQAGSIKRVIANPDAIKRYSLEFYAFAKSLKGAEISAAGKVQNTIQNFEQLLELGESKNLDANHQHIVNLVSWLLQYAFDQRASDIHIEPRRDQGNVRFRIDGLLHSVYKLPSTVMSAVMSRFKILGRMNIAEKRLPQDGRIKTKTQANKEIELRLSTMPTAFGEKLVMRIFDPEVLLRDYQQLGFSPREQKIWTTMSGKLHGIILVTGPTGSGKTTTLYSTLKHLATPEINLCTVEDPIEQVEPNFNQMQVQANIGLTFASGIRALMRQDPDIIMIGEIRDSETAEMAIQASLTGHLVFSTLHTNNAPSAISRLLNIGAPAYLIQQTLLGIMAQRLLRLLCPHCKKPYRLSDEQWQELTKPFTFNKPAHIYQANGCVECRQTGYSGRVGIYEILENSIALRKLIINDCETHALQKQAIKDGMRPLRLSAVEKMGEGLTSLDEILRVTPEMMML